MHTVYASSFARAFELAQASADRLIVALYAAVGEGGWLGQNERGENHEGEFHF